MKTEQEQIEEMSCILTMLINCGGGCMAQYCHLVDNYAKKLIEAGYGDVSEYKAEIEQLKAEVKQAQIDILDRVMTYINNKIENDYGDMSDSVNYLTIDIDDFDDFIDELIKEVENETV